MQTYTLDDFREALAAIGVKQGDAVMAHSSLFRWGRLKDVDFNDLARVLTQTLLDYLGPEGTLVVPIYQYDGIDYIKDYRARQMGALSCYVSGLPRACRTYHTVFSIAAVGRLAESLAEHDSLAAFDEEGPFEFLIREGAQALLMGTEVTAVSVMHVAEYRCRVPYRFWLDVPSERPDDAGRSVQVPYQLFMYDLSRYSRIKAEKVEEWVRSDGLVRETAIGGGWIRTVGFREFAAAVEKRIKADPNILVE